MAQKSEGNFRKWLREFSNLCNDMDTEQAGANARSVCFSPPTDEVARSVIRSLPDERPNSHTTYGTHWEKLWFVLFVSHS